MPVVKGVKSASERFAGADETYTIEALMQNGWALQSGTSHFLGQNFAKAFDVTFQTDTNSQDLVWATSWGVSTRLVGALIMSHSDDAGLVLPPAVAPTQAVVVPISPKGPVKDPEGHAELMVFVDEAVASLRAEEDRVTVVTRMEDLGLEWMGMLDQSRFLMDSGVPEEQARAQAVFLESMMHSMVLEHSYRAADGMLQRLHGTYAAGRAPVKHPHQQIVSVVAKGGQLVAH